MITSIEIRGKYRTVNCILVKICKQYCHGVSNVYIHIIQENHKNKIERTYIQEVDSREKLLKSRQT